MDKKAINIITWLADDTDYFKGLAVLQQNAHAPKGLLQTISRRENPWNRAKLTYLLIKGLNELSGSNEFNEQNFKEKAQQLISELDDSEIQSNKGTSTGSGLIDTDDDKLNKLSNKIGNLLPDELTDKEYAEWFYKQPDKIQKLIKEKGALTRIRAKLHKECREISGNSKQAIELRKTKLNEIDEISLAIKDIHEIVENFKSSGNIITHEIEKTDKKANDKTGFDHLSDLEKKKMLDNLKISLRRNVNALKNQKSQNSKRAISLKEKIASKEIEIAELQKWYDVQSK